MHLPLTGLQPQWWFSSVVVLEESPRPRGSSKTIVQVLVLVHILGSQVQVQVLEESVLDNNATKNPRMQIKIEA